MPLALPHNDIAARPQIVFSDLDGSLLDHFDYSFDPAKPCLTALEQAGIPVVCCTSKTLAELLPLRRQLGNAHPFIVENGAAVFIPEGYFPNDVLSDLTLGVCECSLPGVEPVDPVEGYHGFSFVQSRQFWQQQLQVLPDDLQEAYKSFTELGASGIAAATGLTLNDAELANTRLFSEPLQWQGSDEQCEQLIAYMNKAGARVLRGGRFLHISGACDKGAALRWLSQCYQQYWNKPVSTLAAGDGDNDVAMLEAADMAVVIRSPVHKPPVVRGMRSDEASIYLTKHEGPAGWAEGIEFFLQCENT